MTCPDCERYKKSASMWRNKAYEAAGHPLPWKPDEEHMNDYERGFIDGMSRQAQSSVDRAVNAMSREWQGLTDEEIKECERKSMVNGALPFEQREFFARAIEAKLKEKNNA
jgi:hypothetical protein